MKNKIKILIVLMICFGMVDVIGATKPYYDPNFYSETMATYSGEQMLNNVRWWSVDFDQIECCWDKIPVLALQNKNIGTHP